ncbi:uncharacterized protein SPSK_02013 [Sporothrix schenckii 1099-18]|uniref:Uncharacterized protein n=1 Tax=Sporothrix schenckii 1099-18 TaxID=1397361 RepID=A0A0F2MDV3_SPOSC|nr:uncharacterized protein SPSK_02013 [Sporothrix schenckii 1099-18]KJR87269.1 hypothetical protein SPSK_02013 [Sporothrix schenckii 1099-18]
MSNTSFHDKPALYSFLITVSIDSASVHGALLQYPNLLLVPSPLTHPLTTPTSRVARLCRPSASQSRISNSTTAATAATTDPGSAWRAGASDNRQSRNQRPWGDIHEPRVFHALLLGQRSNGNRMQRNVLRMRTALQTTNEPPLHEAPLSGTDEVSTHTPHLVSML